MNMEKTPKSGLSKLQIILALGFIVAASGLALTYSASAPGQVQDLSEISNPSAPMVENKQEIQPESDLSTTTMTEVSTENSDEKKVEVVSENTDTSAVEAEQVVVKESTTPEPVIVATPGSFSDYDESKLTSDGVNVLFFHADWCPSCRSLENDLNAKLGQIPADVNILKLDYDTENELKKKYGVIRQHTLVVVDGDGIEVRKLTGLTNTLSQVVGQL